MRALFLLILTLTGIVAHAELRTMKYQTGYEKILEGSVSECQTPALGTIGSTTQPSATYTIQVCRGYRVFQANVIPHNWSEDINEIPHTAKMIYEIINVTQTVGIAPDSVGGNTGANSGVTGQWIYADGISILDCEREAKEARFLAIPKDHTPCRSLKAPEITQP